MSSLLCEKMESGQRRPNRTNTKCLNVYTRTIHSYACLYIEKKHGIENSIAFFFFGLKLFKEVCRRTDDVAPATRKLFYLYIFFIVSLSTHGASSAITECVYRCDDDDNRQHFFGRSQNSKAFGALTLNLLAIFSR